MECLRLFSSREKTAESHLRERERETFVQLHPEFQTSSRSIRGVWGRARTTIQDGYRHTHFHRRPQESSDGGENGSLVILQPLVVHILREATYPGEPSTVIHWDRICWWLKLYSLLMVVAPTLRYFPKETPQRHIFVSVLKARHRRVDSSHYFLRIHSSEFAYSLMTVGVELLQWNILIPPGWINIKLVQIWTNAFVK